MKEARSSSDAVQLLDRHEDVARLADQIRTDGIMGIDTEFISESRYEAEIALLQVATRDEIVLIDPLSDLIQEAPDQPIWDAMADPSVLTVVHAYDYESQFCLQRTGSLPGNLFDVQLAAGFTGQYYPMAYHKLVARELRRTVGPSQSRTNWLQRPLTDAQRRYAADDVRWLLRLYDRLSEQLTQKDGGARMRWLHMETDDRLQRLKGQRANRWRRISGANKLSPRSLAALRQLDAWRDSAASRRNRPLRRIASDDLLLAIAATLPTSDAELASVRGIKQIHQSNHPRVLAAVGEALALSDDQLPAPLARHHGGKPSRMVVLFLESVLVAACAKHNIDPALVGNSSQLRGLVSWIRNGRPEDQRPAMISGWRGEVCAEPLLDAIEGRITLRINDPLSAHPLALGSVGSTS